MGNTNTNTQGHTTWTDDQLGEALFKAAADRGGLTIEGDESYHWGIHEINNLRAILSALGVNPPAN